MITEKDVNNAILKAAKDVYLHAIVSATPKNTGKVAKAWKIKLTENGFPVIYNEKFGDIIKFLEEGTQGPYKIEAKNAKALKFTIGTKTIFAKWVMHPGIIARRFIQKVMDDDVLQKRFSNAIQAEIAFLITTTSEFKNLEKQGYITKK